ncbi:MAG: flagellar hook-basal body complex protein [Planctomycetaceae bacterium]|nr:flagellar hook-basal body complex protein [Planctomycetaceae bacterium]
MSNSLLSGISGLQAHQRMLDVAGNNLANVNTSAFKASRVTFAELLSQTLQEAGQPSATTGGTNPMQVGSGVQVASIDRNMSQGSLISTGQPLDMAIEGSGYFALSDGSRLVYTRVGGFAVDSQFYLVDPGTGNRVQRIGSEGVADGFQNAASNDIRIPYDVALPANQTESISYTGNLSAEESDASANILTSGLQYTKDGAVISADTLLAQVDQVTGLSTGDTISITGTRRDGTSVSSTFTTTVGPTTNQLSSLVGYTAAGVAAVGGTALSALDQADTLADDETFTISGTDADGTAISRTYAYHAGDTMTTLLGEINAAYSGATATLADGKILLTDDAAGASETTMSITYNGEGEFTLPASFNRLTTGGDGSTIGDLLNAVTNAFADPNNPTDRWSVASMSNGEIRMSDVSAGYSQTDLSLSCTGATFELPQYFTLLSAGGNAIRNTNMEIYDSQGISHVMSAAFVRTDTSNTWDLVVTSLGGDVSLQDRRINGITFLADGSFGGVSAADSSTFKVTFANDPSNIRTLNINLGTIGEFDGLSQFGGSSTVAPSGQDGYAAGWLSNISVTREGVLVGVFTNGARRDLAALRIATFQNPAGLASVGNNYFEVSANSGDPVATKAMSGSAGAIRGGSMEQSNVDVATEFVNLIQAQNGFQANARTIKAANEMLQELTNLTR